MHSQRGQKGSITIPEKVRKGLRVKPGDKLQYEVEENRATVRVHPGIRSLKGALASRKEKECLSLKSAKPPLSLCARADIAFCNGASCHALASRFGEVTIHLDDLNRHKGSKPIFVDCLLAATAAAKGRSR